MGIEDENPNNIFLPFYSTKKQCRNNLGLGLYVSYGIIRKYRGDISVRNLEKAGCDFTVIFPGTYPSQPFAKDCMRTMLKPNLDIRSDRMFIHTFG